MKKYQRIKLNRFAERLRVAFSQELTEDVKAEYRVNDVQVALELFDLLEKCSEDTLHILLEGFITLAKVNRSIFFS